MLNIRFHSGDSAMVSTQMAASGAPTNRRANSAFPETAARCRRGPLHSMTGLSHNPKLRKSHNGVTPRRECPSGETKARGVAASIASAILHSVQVRTREVPRRASKLRVSQRSSLNAEEICWLQEAYDVLRSMTNCIASIMGATSNCKGPSASSEKQLRSSESMNNIASTRCS
jgi:hypothetical protein